MQVRKLRDRNEIKKQYKTILAEGKRWSFLLYFLLTFPSTILRLLLIVFIFFLALLVTIL